MQRIRIYQVLSNSSRKGKHKNIIVFLLCFCVREKRKHETNHHIFVVETEKKCFILIHYFQVLISLSPPLKGEK